MSESPEEQPSTGVLGRIGSWLSPWRGRGPKSPSENESTTSDQALKSEGEEKREESVTPQAKEPQREEEEEEEKGQSSNPNPSGCSRDIFPSEEQDATQSAHRDCSVASSTETAEGGPKEEEFGECRKKRIGQGKEREESSNGASGGGNPERNASHLTHHSSSSEQGVVWDEAHAQAQVQTQVQAQTGRRLHVYLEETSVIQSSQDTCPGQEVVCTKVTKPLQVTCKANESFDSSKSSSLTSVETKRTNVRPVVGKESYYSALAGVSLKQHTDSQFEAEPDHEQTEADSMGRKNSARKKVRKNSQGDGGNSPQETKPPTSQAIPEGFPASDNSVTSPQGKSPKAPLGESTVNSSSSSSKHKPTFQASPEGGDSKTACPDTVKPLDNFQDSNSVTAAAPACVADGMANMEDNDSFYKVERKTETPESKRRSIKVSRSEVKLFSKSVPLNPKQSPAGDKEEFKKNTNDEAKTETGAKLQDLQKIVEEPKPVVGRIADKISLFERPALGINKQILQTPRSADASPVRNATERLKEKFVLAEQRSRSAERYSSARSSSASPAREKPMTVKERARNFAEASKTGRTAGLPQQAAMTGMSQKSTSSVAIAASKSPELDNLDKRDSKEQIQINAMAEIPFKPDGQVATAVEEKSDIPKEQTTDSKTKPNSVEANVPAKGPGDSSELTNSISPQSKGLGRTGSRSKRRKNKEPTSPLSPNSANKPDCSTNKAEVTAIKQGQVDDKDETASASKQLTEKVSLPSDEARGDTSDKQPDSKPKALKKELKVLDKQKNQSDSSFKKGNIDKPVNRQTEGLPQPSVNKDEPDTAARSNGTKMSIDKDPAILPQKEEKAGGDSVLFTQEREPASKDSRGTSGSPSSPAVERKPSLEQGPPVEHTKLVKESPMHSEQKSKDKVRQPNKKDTGRTRESKNEATDLINQTESKDEQKLENMECKKTNSTEKKDKETPQRLSCSDKNTTKAKLSDSRHAILVTEGSVACDGKKEKTQPAKHTTKPETNEPQPTSESLDKAGVASSDLRAQTEVGEVTEMMAPQSNDALSGTKRHKGPPKGETSVNVSTELQTKSAESPGIEREHVVVATEPQPESVCVEKTKNSPDDSCTHGANDAQFSSSMPTAKETTALEEVNVTSTNDTSPLITAQTHSAATPKCLSSEGAGQDDGVRGSAVKSVPPETKISREITELTPSRPQCEESKTTESASDIASLKDAEVKAHRSSDGTVSSSTVKAAANTAGKTRHSPMDQLLPVTNGYDSPHTQLRTVEKEPVNNKPSQTPKAPGSPEADKPIPDSIQRSSMKKLHLPRELSKGQDAPSSWLDVDVPKQKLRVSLAKLSSSGSESNLLDNSGELDDDDFIEKIKKLCAPFSLPPRKHNQFRPPQPPFAMPAIKEDRFEKTFDPEEFQFGLRKNKSIDTTPSILAKLKSKETKSGLKPARASFADRSMLLGGLDTRSRLRDKIKDEEEVKEEKDDQIKVKSRLEGSCVLSSLISGFRGKRNGAQTQDEGTSSPDSGDVSPSEAPQLSPLPSSQPPPVGPTAAAPLKDTLAKQSSREEARAAEAVVSDSGPPLPSFNDIKLPDYLEKYLPREAAKSVQSVQGQEQVRTEVFGNTSTAVPADEADLAMKPLPGAVPPCIPGIPPTAHPEVPEVMQPQGTLGNDIRAAKGFHKRPGKMVLFEKANFGGQAYEVYRDVADATSLQLSSLISVKVVRGCWVLYEKPGFQGRSIALEEGAIELTNVWAEPGPETEPHSSPPMLIGSARLAVWDYSIPHIDLFTEPEGHGRITPYHDDTVETGSFGIPLSTASIQVHSGVWLVFSDPGFQGMLAVLETGVYPFPETWGFPSPFVGSLRPLKMGGFKVENPTEVKAVVYEKPGFDGSCLEIDSDIFSFCESEEVITTDESNRNSKKLKSVGSLKITGGLWVGYSQPGFEGQQHILEEGEYLHCSDWGGSEQLLSLRPILTDFMTPHLKMFSDRDFGELGVNLDLTVPVINMDDTGYGFRTQSIDVISGVWVVFEEPGFCGESCILEKGLYGTPEDWGALQPRVASAMPVVLDYFENAAKFKVQLFSEPGLQGSVLALEDSVASLQDGFSFASCKVLAGSWLAFEGRDFTGRMYVLELGSYPDLKAMGCFHENSSILSLQTVGFEFSLPSITLFERCGLRGKRVVLTDGSVNLQLAGGCSRVQSVLVEGGMWVLYEGINFRGAQILLKPGEVPDWRKLSSWRKIGSLRPLMQKQVHFRLRNRQSGLMMSVTGDLDDVKLLRIQETEENGGFEQIWFYRNGHLHCKLLEECCLSPSGSMTMAGSRVGLTAELDNQVHLWSITSEGFICYTPTSDLVLEVKGGHHYDKNQVILNTLDPHKLHQRWNVEII